jgi:hypothetical protein
MFFSGPSLQNHRSTSFDENPERRIRGLRIATIKKTFEQLAVSERARTAKRVQRAQEGSQIRVGRRSAHQSMTPLA